MKDCSALYAKAKKDGTLGGMKWNDFRKAKCSADATIAEPDEAPAKTKKAATTAAAGGLTIKECSAKYQAAKAKGTLGGLKWNDFRSQQCGADAADDPTVPEISEANYGSEPDLPSTTAPAGIKFPRKISSKFANESPGKGRLHTCLESYYSNKEDKTLAGMKWIQKGGGFYSQCNAKLKGQLGA